VNGVGTSKSEWDVKTASVLRDAESTNTMHHPGGSAALVWRCRIARGNAFQKAKYAALHSHLVITWAGAVRDEVKNRQKKRDGVELRVAEGARASVHDTSLMEVSFERETGEMRDGLTQLESDRRTDRISFAFAPTPKQIRGAPLIATANWCLLYASAAVSLRLEISTTWRRHRRWASALLCRVRAQILVLAPCDARFVRTETHLLHAWVKRW
jgi:hypothetical protein